MTDLSNEMLISDVPSLSNRARSCCFYSNIFTVGQLRAMSDRELMDIPNLGIRTLVELRAICLGHTGPVDVVRLQAQIRDLYTEVRSGNDRIRKLEAQIKHLSSAPPLFTEEQGNAAVSAAVRTHDYRRAVADRLAIPASRAGSLLSAWVRLQSTSDLVSIRDARRSSKLKPLSAVDDELSGRVAIRIKRGLAQGGEHDLVRDLVGEYGVKPKGVGPLIMNWLRRSSISDLIDISSSRRELGLRPLSEIEDMTVDPTGHHALKKAIHDAAIKIFGSEDALIGVEH